jgi:hypothetical protein
MKNIKSFNSFNNKVNEGFWNSIFGNPTVKDAAHTALRGTGSSMTGKDDSTMDDHNYIMFNGQKFYPEQIEYADYQDLGELPRVENGKLLIANPAWSM